MDSHPALSQRGRGVKWSKKLLKVGRSENVTVCVKPGNNWHLQNGTLLEACLGFGLWVPPLGTLGGLTSVPASPAVTQQPAPPRT